MEQVTFPPLQYPAECHDPSVPKAAREELKARIREAHQEVCVAAMHRNQELIEEARQEALRG